MNDIAKQLIKAREVRKIDQEQLALLTGLSVELISKLELGDLEVNVSVLLQISNALNCTFSLGDVSI